MAESIGRYARVLVLCLLSAWAAPCAAQGGVTWQWHRPATSPVGRIEHAMVSDAGRQRLVMFGGTIQTSPAWVCQNDTWEWDGVDWTRRSPSQRPTERSQHAMAYDAVRGRTVLFGGLEWSYTELGDTWEWDGASWQQLSPAQSPPPRYDHSMAFDAARQRVVLFGGLGSGSQLLDTWEWDGSTWTQRFPTVSPTSDGPMVYDAARQRVVLYFIQTWEWDGANWTRLFPANRPLAGTAGDMAYHPGRRRTVLFESAARRTWEWDGVDWTGHPRYLSPNSRGGHVMSYDATRDEVMLFGGITSSTGPLAETWGLGSVSPASFGLYGTGCPGTQGVPSLAAAPHSLPWTGDAFAVELGNLPPGCLPFLALGFTGAPTPIPPLPGCTQLCSAEVAVILSPVGGVATWSQVVPTSSVLVGWSLFLQGAALNAGGSNPLGAVLSGGGRATIGLR